MPLIYLVTVTYFAGTLGAGFVAVPLWVSGAGVLCTAPVALYLRRSNILFAVSVCLLSLFVALFMYETDTRLSTRNSLTEYLRIRENRDSIERVWGTVAAVKKRGDNRLDIVLKADSVRLARENNLKVSGRAYVRYYGDEEIDPRYGERWSFEGRMYTLEGLSPGARRFYRMEGVSARMYVSPQGIKERAGRGDAPLVMTFGDGLRRRFAEVLHERISEPYSGILGRMLLGKGVEIDPGAEETFRSAGLAHVLVVSGMHVWFMLGTFLFMSFLWNRRPVISFAVLGLVLTGYYAVSGGGPSIMRATIMGFVFLAALLFGTDYRARAALFLAALVMMIVNPLSIYQIGTQLTFMASAGVVFIYPVLSSFFPKRTWWFRLFRGFLVAVAAQLPIYPVIAYHFNQFCAVAPLSNLVVVPLVGLALPLDLLTCVLGLLPGGIAAVPAFLAGRVAWLMLTAAEFFSGIPGATMEVSSPGITWILVYLAALAVFVTALKWTHEKSDEMIMAALGTFAVLAFILVVPFVWNPPLSGIRATFIDVQEGDAVLLEFPLEKKGGRVFRMLVDAGGTWGYVGERYDPGERSVGRYLMKRGIRRLDAVVLTHPEADHMNGLRWLLENVKVDRFMDIGEPRKIVCEEIPGAGICAEGGAEEPGPELVESQEAIYRGLLRAVKEKGIEYVPLRAGSVMETGSGARVEILAPGMDAVKLPAGEDCLNNMSAVLKVSYGGGSVLLTGDIEREAEEWLLKYQGEKLESDLLKVPHHGSMTSSTSRFLERVKPAAAVISTGGPAYYGHPHRAALDRYESKRINVYRTDRQGTVRCTVSNRGEVECRGGMARVYIH